jgi:hemolysin activation/secretion protein
MSGRLRPARAGSPRPRLWLLCGCVAALGAAHAQTVPGSGELLQQTPRVSAPAPASSPGLTIQQPAAGAHDDSPPFLVRHIEITGNSLLSTAELHALVETSEGKTLNLGYLEELAAAITKRYQDRGYLLSRAYIPPQTLSDDTVRIAVLEARYGAVSLANSSRVSDALLKSYLTPLRSGQPVVEDALERRLLLLADVPGAVVNSTIAPGAAVGTSDLQVTAVPGAPYDVALAADNGGNRYTGRDRVTATANMNDPLGHGDVLSVTGLTAGANLDYGRLAYQSLLPNGAGTSVAGSVSGLYYHLANGLSQLHAHGTAQTESVTVMQPFIRSVKGNLFAQVGFESRQLRDEVDVTDIHTDRRTYALTATLAGDRRDGSGISNMNASLTAGQLDFQNSIAEAADFSTAKTRGGYAKLNVSLARLQGLTQSNSLYVAFNGQIADKNLDSSEQFFVGGPNSVRAYDVGAVGGAVGALASLELRHNLGAPLPGAWQAIAFVDSGVVRVYKNVFAAGENSATLSGAGVGLNWVGPHGWAASGSLAAPIGHAPILAGDRASSRLWIEIHKAFPGSAASR